MKIGEFMWMLIGAGTAILFTWLIFHNSCYGFNTVGYYLCNFNGP